MEPQVKCKVEVYPDFIRTHGDLGGIPLLA